MLKLGGLVDLQPLKEMDNPCWKGYEMVGTKKKDGREVPNCVPMKEFDMSQLLKYLHSYQG